MEYLRQPDIPRIAMIDCNDATVETVQAAGFPAV